MRNLLALFIISLPLFCYAQNNTTYYSLIEKKEEYKNQLDFDFTYNYNYTTSSQLLADVQYKHFLTDWVDLQAGIHIATNKQYALHARANFKWNIKSHHKLELRNQYFYNIFAENNTQSINALLAAAYNQDYCYIALGVYTQAFFPLFPKGESSKVVEPIGICYDIEGRIFPEIHKWNLGLQITNITQSMVERTNNPNFILKGAVKIVETNNERIDLNLKLGIEPAGIFHIHSEQYEIFFGAGVKCLI